MDASWRSFGGSGVALGNPSPDMIGRTSRPMPAQRPDRRKAAQLTTKRRQS